jgi:hypothetical protein
MPMSLDFSQELHFIKRGDIVDMNAVPRSGEKVGKRVWIQLGVEVNRQDGPEPLPVCDGCHFLQPYVCGWWINKHLYCLIRRS